MDIEYVLNEISISAPFADQAAADNAMCTFVDVLRQSREIGIRPNVRCQKSLQEIELTPGYFISNWCVNQSVVRERRLYVMKLLTNSPLVKGLPERLKQDFLEVEVLHDGTAGEGLTVAYLSENPVLSFDRDEKWRPKELEVQVRKLSVDGRSGTEEIAESKASILNFCLVENLKENLELVRKMQQQRFSSFEDFWNKKEALFPKLIFAPGFLGNLRELGESKHLFPQIVSLLVKLNALCDAWNQGPFITKDSIPNVSLESTTTMQEFGEQRKFADEAGNYHVCEHHARLTPGAHRLHFRPIEDERKVFVGYIGSKLPTSMYRT